MISSAETNATDILRMVKEPGSGFREWEKLAVRCKCGRGLLVRVYTGPDEEAGVRRTWLLVPPSQLKDRILPAEAFATTEGAGVVKAFYSFCRRCRQGVVGFTAAGGPAAERRESGEPLYVMVGDLPGTPFREGDPYQYVEGDEWLDGPAESAFLRVGPPTHGTVVSDGK